MATVADITTAAGAATPDAAPLAAALARLVRYLRTVRWFASLGTPLSPAERSAAEAYTAALGFPSATVALIADWDEAEAAAGNPDWNTAWWEAEEQLRAALIAEAAPRWGEAQLTDALAKVNAAAADIALPRAAAAARRHCQDQGLIRAAAGAATQGCYQAALVLAAGADENHPFAIKFRLLEAGRWPLGIVGGSLNLF